MGFNPCFSGSSTATFEARYDIVVSNQFQSLFFWKFHCNDVTLNCTYVNDLECFNPCFSGSSTATVAAKLLIRTVASVSILVFLEVPLQLPDDLVRDENGNMFQSLFFWKFHCNAMSLNSKTQTT